MVRLWREIGSVEFDDGAYWLVFWAVLVTFCIIPAIVFSCADGVSKEKSATTNDTELYGGAGCAAGCGAGCGA